MMALQLSRSTCDLLSRVGIHFSLAAVACMSSRQARLNQEDEREELSRKATVQCTLRRDGGVGGGERVKNGRLICFYSGSFEGMLESEEI